MENNVFSSQWTKSIPFSAKLAAGSATLVAAIALPPLPKTFGLDDEVAGKRPFSVDPSAKAW